MIQPTRESMLQECLRELVGHSCWAVIAGPGSGSRIVMNLGEKVRRDKPLTNPTLTSESRDYEGEFSLFVEDCAWRLEKNGVILCSSKSDNRAGGEFLTGIQMLVGSRAEDVNASAPGHDLFIRFDKGLVFRTFSDCCSQETDGDNYTVFTRSLTVSVGAKGELRGEHRQDGNRVFDVPG